MSLIAGRGCRWPPRRDSVSPCAPLSGGRDTHDGHENSPILVFFSNLLARIIRKGSDFGSQDGVIVSRTKDRTLPLWSAGHGGRKIGRMARCERPAGQLRRGRSREAR